MKLDKLYTPQDIRKWPFGKVCEFRKAVWDRYLRYNEADMQMVNAGLKIIDNAYQVAVKISLDGVEINEEVCNNLKMTEADLQTITRYRVLVMAKMAALPPNILKTMQLLRNEFGNY